MLLFLFFRFTLTSDLFKSLKIISIEEVKMRLLAFILNFMVASVMLLPVLAVADCEIDPKTAALHYEITQKELNSDQLESKSFTLWRYQNRVAIQYQHSHTTELWEQTKRGDLRLVRYFNDYHRGIEYQPNEIHFEGADSDWSSKYQLVSNSLLKRMTGVSSEEKKCSSLKTLYLEENTQSIWLTWLADLNILQSMRIKDKKNQIDWKLTHKFTEKDQVEDFFANLDSFDTVDYADVGDNETDPFLLKMINLGFIEHSHSH